MIEIAYIKEASEMAIPKEVLGVERPKNTVVYSYGKGGLKYAVKKRVGCKRVGGRNLPVNGPTIGHVVGGKFIPIDKRGAETEGPDLKDWANASLADSLFRDVLVELRAEYDEPTSERIYAASILRVIYPDIADYELQAAYSNSWLSKLYPGIALSKNTVSALWDSLGEKYSKIVSFMRSRAGKVSADSRLLLDGTLKSDESKINSLSDFSRKARLKGSRDISVIFAFDLDKREPVCSMCYPGNMLDVTSYGDFVRKCGVTKGVIVADKGFPSSAAGEEFERNPDLHFLNPIKRNSKAIETNSMLKFEGVLQKHDGILFKKAKSGKKWLYSYRDIGLAAKEESDWVARAKKSGEYDDKELREKRGSFGTMVLECDLEMSAEQAYDAYSERWEIEIVMRYYKHACGFDETRVHSDYSVYGSEFCDFLSTVLTFRLLKAFESSVASEKFTYGRLIKKLERAKRVKVSAESDWELVRTNPSDVELLKSLGLLPKDPEQPKRKRGRPRKIAA
jgi:transposase